MSARLEAVAMAVLHLLPYIYCIGLGMVLQQLLGGSAS